MKIDTKNIKVAKLESKVNFNFGSKENKKKILSGEKKLNLTSGELIKKSNIMDINETD